MKQIIILLLFSMALVSCNSKKIATLKIGVTEPTAHLLKFIEKNLDKQGVKIELKVYDNYVTPNIDLYTGDLDANFFQHKPYLDDFNEATGTDLVSAGNI